MTGSVPLLLATLLALMHPDSMSTSRLVVDEDAATLTMRCQVRSIAEVVARLDGDEDGTITAAEIDAQRQPIIDYVGAHYILRDDDGPLPLRESVLVHHAPGVVGGPLDRDGAIDLVLRFDRRGRGATLTIASTLFAETSPGHLDLLETEWAGGPAQHHVLTASSAPIVVRAGETRRGSLAFFVLGARHILTGWDHLAFLAVLIVGARRLRTLIGVVTAFTVAHSVTLGLAALDVVDVAAYATLVEMGIALSIVWVAGDTLLDRDLRRGRWFEAFAFGLVHGLGFASFLGRSLVGAGERWSALVFFNLGIEAVQIGLVIAAALGLGAMRRRARTEMLAPLLARRVISGAVFVLGVMWFVDRLV